MKCSWFVCVLFSSVGFAQTSSILSGPVSITGTTIECNGTPTPYSESGIVTVTLQPALDSLVAGGGNVTGSAIFSDTKYYCGKTSPAGDSGSVTGVVSPGGQMTLTFLPNSSGKCSITAAGTTTAISGTIPSACFDQPATGTFTATRQSSVTSLQVSPSSLSFTALAGGNSPPSQSISVTAGSLAGQIFKVTTDSGQSGSAAPAWLSVSPVSGTAPSQLVVSVNQGSMPAGSYPGRVNVIDANGNSMGVSVTLTIFAAQPSLQVSPTYLAFSTRADAPGVFQQAVAVSNSGGGGSLGFSAVVAGGSPWLSVMPSSGQAAANSPVLAQVVVNTQGLQIGGYQDTIHFSSSAGNVDVAVSLFVAGDGPILAVNQTGVHFTAQQGGGIPKAQDVEVLNIGEATVNWTASVVSGANFLSLGATSGTATVATPGLLPLQLNSGALQLAPGTYDALVSIADANSRNSPQYVVVVLNLQSGTSAPALDPTPAGLFFSGPLNGAQPATQQIIVNTSGSSPVAFQAAASTTSGGNWLTVSPVSGTSTGQTPGTVTVSANTSGLVAGTYSGSVSFSISGTIRTVNIVLVVLPASGSSTGMAAARAAGCTPSKLVIVESGLADDFVVPATYPATLNVQLYDDCASPVTSGSVVASFSNGDPQLVLRSDLQGAYSATWQTGAVSRQTVVTMSATSGRLQPAMAQLIGGITPNQAPALAPHGTVNNANPVLGAPLAPGTVAQVYGSGLATSSVTPSSIPLSSMVNGTSMLVGGLVAPLYYLSSGQLNIQIPSELTPNQQYATVVGVNNQFSLPDTINVVPMLPGVAAFGDGHVIAQHNSNFALVDANHPATPGEYVTIYLVGMGATTPSVASGVAAPSSEPLARIASPATVTLGSAPVTIAYAGLTPGAVGLYQITFLVPAVSTAGDVPLAVSQGGISANTTKLICAAGQ